MTRKEWHRLVTRRPMSLHDELRLPLRPRRILVACQRCGAVPYFGTTWYFTEIAGILGGVCPDCHEAALPDLGGLDLEPVGSGA